ncbi:hypothetical protein FRC19_001450 [Serendipita sp. 401]|nr:hypothetical protein FRC19_001450 [Serendipita sp. 401]
MQIGDKILTISERLSRRRAVFSGSWLQRKKCKRAVYLGAILGVLTIFCFTGATIDEHMVQIRRTSIIPLENGTVQTHAPLCRFWYWPSIF